MLIGYARVSTVDQSLDLQLDALAAAGVEPGRIWTDKASGMRADRPGLAGALKAARAGDVLVVWRLDRLARSSRELLALADRLRAEGVELRSLCEAIDTTTAAGKLVYTVFAAMAEFERNLISERTVAGMRAKNRRGGRPAKLTSRQIEMARGLLAEPKWTADQVARQFGVDRTTLYRAIRRADQAAGK